MRTRTTARLTLGLTFAAALTLGVGRTALADPAERACVGAFISGEAHANGGNGATVRQEAKDFHPFGQLISPIATTCEFPF